MTITAAVLFVVFLSALVGGAGVGWVVRDRMGRAGMDPSFAKIYQSELEKLEQQHAGQIAVVEKKAAEDRLMYHGLLSHRGPAPPPPIPSAPHAPVTTAFEDPNGGYVPDGAVGDGLAAAFGVPARHAAVRNALIQRTDLTEVEVDDMLSGQYAGKSGPEQADLLIDDALRRATGLP